ncbi:MAG: hypothetical protein KC417_08000 [Myxococcales bacterium]|nr:hypothetical protein [Myxococcales bacterium]
MLVLDNLESADTATLAALRSLGKLRGDHHTLVVASIRGELPAELVGVARVVDVAPLSSTEILEYVDRTLPGPVRHLEQLAGALASDTHGNPLDIWAALNGWLDRGVINRASTSTPWEFSASSPTHPTPIANLYALRAEKLSEDARTIARLLAIRGGEVRSAWIADVLNWEKGTSDLAISELCNAGLVQHRANGTYTFLHDSLRELVIESATKPQRLSTHHAIVRWLDRHPEDTQVGLAAFHREHLTDAGENPELAALHVLAGNEGLTRFDLDASAWHFACAQERSTSIQTTVRSLTGSGDVTAMRNQGETASALYQKAIELAETRAERAEIGSRAVYTLHCRTGNEYSLAVAQHALRALDQPLPQTTIQTIWALLKNIVMIALNVHSRESEDVQDHLAALYTRLSPLLIVRPAMLLVAAMQGVRAAGTRTSGPAATALGFWGVLHCSLGMYKKAERIFDDAESRARQSEHAWSLGVVLHMRGHCLDLPRGSYSAGQQHLDAAVECFEQSGDQSIASLTLMFKTFYGRDRENVTLLGEWLEKAKAIATRHGNQLAEPPLIALGLLLQARLRSASVKSDIAVFLRDLDEREPGVFVGDVVTARTLTAEALQLIGDAEGAYQQARRATQLLGKGPVIEVLLESYAALASSIVKLPVVSASQKRELAIAISKLRASADSAPRMHLAALAATAQQLNLNGSNEYAAVAFERAISEADRNGSALTGANLRVDFAELLTKLDAGRSARELKFARNQFRTLGFPQRTTECSSRGDALPTLESPVITPASRRALNGSLENASERVLVAHTNAWARSTIVQRLNQLGVTSIDEAGTVPPAGYWTMAFVEEALVSDLDRTRAKKLVTLVRRLQNSDADVVLSFPFAANELAKLLVESGITPNEEEPPTE